MAGEEAELEKGKKGVNIPPRIKKLYGDIKEKPSSKYFGVETDPLTGKDVYVLNEEGISVAASLIEDMGGEVGLFKHFKEGDRSFEIASTLKERRLSYSHIEFLYALMQYESEELMRCLDDHIMTPIGDIGYYEKALKPTDEAQPNPLEPTELDLDLAALFLGFIVSVDNLSTVIRTSIVNLRATIPESERTALEQKIKEFDKIQGHRGFERAPPYTGLSRMNPPNLDFFLGNVEHFERLRTYRNAINQAPDKRMLLYKGLEGKFGISNPRQVINAVNYLLDSTKSIGEGNIKTAAQYLILFRDFLPKQLTQSTSPDLGVQVHNGISPLYLLGSKHFSYMTLLFRSIRGAFKIEEGEVDEDVQQLMAERAEMAGIYAGDGLFRVYVKGGIAIPCPLVYKTPTSQSIETYTKHVNEHKDHLLPPEEPEKPEEGDYEGKKDEFEAAQGDYQARMTGHQDALGRHKTAERTLRNYFGDRVISEQGLTDTPTPQQPKK